MKHDLSQFKHKLKIEIRFSDLDAMRHVNNATYLTFIEEARIAYFNEVLGRDKSSLNYSAIVARIEIDYLQPINLGDKLEVLTRVSKLGNKSTDVENLITIERKGEHLAAATALTKLVAYDYDKLESIRIPENIRQKIEQFEK